MPGNTPIGSNLVSAQEVRVVKPTEMTDSEIDVFITTAHSYMESRLGSASVSTAAKKEVEKFLAAHFMAIREPQAKQEKIGSEYAVTYAGETGEGLRSTSWGQAAILLDPTGRLETSFTKLIQFRSLGDRATGLPSTNEG